MDDGYQGIFLLTHHISFNLYSLYCQTPVLSLGLEAEVEKVVDSASLTHRKYFQKQGLTENIWENIMG